MNSGHKKLRAEKLCKKYGDFWAVREANLEVKKGEIVGLLGPNGAGKTTTFYMITGMIKPTSGDIFLDDSNITKKAMYQRSRYGIGYLPQDESIFRKLSVEEIENIINKNVYPADKEDLKVEDDKGSAMGALGLKPKIVH